MKMTLRVILSTSNISIIVLSAIYGAVMGLYVGGVQILHDAVKIPMASGMVFGTLL